MTTPICDFVRRYAERAPLRLHMPGHKGLGAQENRLDLVTGETLFVCDSPEDVGEPPCPAPIRETMRSGPRIGVDYAEEARDFPWRFWLETEELK